MPSIRLTYAIALLIFLLSVLVVSAQPAPAPATPLTSVAIDPGLFRDGAIKRFSGTHEAWTYVCDEVAKMKKRFCSLRSHVIGPDGRVVAALTISTGEDGRPAALLAMAGSSFNETGIEVSAKVEPTLAQHANKQQLSVDSAKPNKSKLAAMRLYPAACQENICQMIWTLPQEHIRALSSGVGLRLRFTPATAGVSPLASALRQNSVDPIEAAIDARGFAAAVDASVKLADYP